MSDPVDRAPSTVTAAQSDGNTAHLHAMGEFDLADHELLAETLRTAVSRGHQAVEVDFSAVTFIDAGTIRVLLQCRDFAAEYGCAFRVVNPTGMSVTILQATGTTELLYGIAATSAATPAGGRQAVSGGMGTPCPNAARSRSSPWCGRPAAGNTGWARLDSWNGPTASRRANNSANVPKLDPGTDPRRRPTPATPSVPTDAGPLALATSRTPGNGTPSSPPTCIAVRFGAAKLAAPADQHGRMRPGLSALLGLTPSPPTAISGRDIAATVARDDSGYAVLVEVVADHHECWNWRPNQHTVQRLCRRDSSYFTGCRVAQMSVLPITSTHALPHIEYSRCRPGNCPA